MLCTLVCASGDRDLELARQIRELEIPDELGVRFLENEGGVHYLGCIDPGEGASEEVPRGVAASFGRRQTDRLDLLPYRGHVLDADPMQLDVLAVGDVGNVPSVTLGHIRDRG